MKTVLARDVFVVGLSLTKISLNIFLVSNWAEVFSFRVDLRLV